MTNISLLRYTLILLTMLVANQLAFATHNRAGEIRIEQIGTSGRIRAIVTTYTAFQGVSAAADRPQLEINWGDGTVDIANRTNGPLDGNGIPSGVPIANNLKKNEYILEHTYSNARGAYRVSIVDPNRIVNIINIAQSNAVFFFIQTVFTFLDPNFQGPNSTPILLQPPIDDGCVGQRFVHNPNAFDPDGDSLAYRLGIPLGDGGEPIASYRFPSEFSSGAGNSSFVLDEVSGTLTWDRPRRAGNYNTVILVISYRNGIAIDTTLRDMQIFITECDNIPPEIEVAKDFCLIAGETLTLDPIATAPLAEPTQRVLLDVTSSTLELDFKPATWTGDSTYQDQPFTARYTWETDCEHSERYPYKAIFKATDDFGDQGGALNLSWLEVVNILVSAPPPEDLQIEAENGLIDLSWASPYACDMTQDSFFYGFSVWRREGSNNFPYDSCRQGLAGRGYTRIENRTRAQTGGRYVFADDDIERGRTYCYRVLAQFVRYTRSGRPFNLVESIPSMEICIQSSRDLPLLTKADVLETDVTNGRVDVRWTPPLAEDLDTIENPAPYTYEVLRSPGVGTATFTAIPGTLTSYPTFTALQRDTQFIDTGLNTVDQGYTYAIRFTTNGSDNGIAPLPSSTIYLEVASTDQVNQLSWQAETSWENQVYAVLRQNGPDFDTIARVQNTSYNDGGLVNGEEYCYKVVGFGTYGVSTIYSPLINNSQQRCGIPLDTIAPCPPSITVRTQCDDDGEAPFDATLPNTINWTFADCPPAVDLEFIRVYELVDSAGTSRRLLGEVSHPTMVFDDFRDLEVSACYAVTAVDSLGNESDLSASVCVANCPLYILPNVITPNGDNVHDVLRPRVNRFVDQVEFTLFNRWGVQVYNTTDPSLGWDGTTPNGNEVTTGTFFYTCSIFQQLPNGNLELVGDAPIEGFIEVLK